jgi:photosystem II stability/assembly factor-like uncharacterized protein
MKKSITPLIVIILIITCQSASGIFWNKTNGPSGGTILNFVETSQGLLAAGSNGMYSSNDDGNLWTTIPAFQGTEIYELVRCSDSKLYTSCVGRLMVSSNNGSTWSNIASGFLSDANIKFTRRLNSNNIITIAHRSHQYNKLFRYDTANSSWNLLPDAANLHLCMEYSPATNYLYIGTYRQGIFRSGNDGNSFVNCGLDTTTVLTIHIDSQGWIFAGTMYNGVYYSTNNGESWTQFLQDLDNVSAVYSNGLGVIYVGTVNDGIYKSTNNGGTWIQLNDGLIDKYVRTFYQTSDGDMLLGQNSAGSYKWSSSFSAWEDKSNGMNSITINDIIVLNKNEVFVSGNHKGIFYSQNCGQTWSLRSIGLPLGNYPKLAMNSSGNIFTAGTNGDIFISTNRGVNWSRVSQPQSSTLSAYKINTFNNDQFIGLSNQSILKSTDGGLTWVSKGPSGILVKDFTFVSSNIAVAVTFGQGIYKSTDSGETWNVTGNSTGEYSSVEYIGNNVFFAGSNSGIIFKSTNGGNTWQSSIDAISSVNDFSFSGMDTIFASTYGNGVFFSTDGGGTWVKTAGGLTNLNINCIKILNDTVIFAGGDYGLYSTSTLPPQLTRPNLILPENGTANLSKNPIIKWSSVSQATSYKYLISTQSDFSVIIEQKIVQDTIVQLQTDLEYGKMYYWKVCAQNGTYEGPFSITRIFSTMLAIPILVSPADKSTGVLSPVVFKWKSVSNAKGYFFQLSMDNDFNTVVIEKNLTGDTIFNAGSLSPFKKYFWRIKATNDFSESKYSAFFDFETGMQAPCLISPKNNYFSPELTQNLTWSSVPEAAYYIIETYNKENFTSADLITRDTSTKDTFLTKTFNYGEKIYWRVKASTNGKETGWSNVWGFSVGEKGPTLLSPVNNANNQEIKIILIWDPLTKIDFYEFIVASDSGFVSVDISMKLYKETSFQAGPLKYGKKYYWKVRASKSSKLTLWSEIWNFTIGTKPPTLKLPLNNTKGIQLDGEFTWDLCVGALSYSIQIASDSGFSRIIETKSGLTERKFVSAKLERFKPYYWRVNASMKNMTSLWSEIWSFETGLNKPFLSEPANNSTGVSLNNAELRWDPVIGAEYYQLILALDPNFNDKILSKDTIFLNSIVIKDLQSQKRYWWKVKALCELGASNWSDPFSFETGNGTSVDEKKSNSRIDVMVYPCPFRNTVNFTIKNGCPGPLKLKIYSLLSFLVKETRMEKLSVGEFYTSWTPEGLSPGIFFFYILDNKDNLLYSGNFIYIGN